MNALDNCPRRPPHVSYSISQSVCSKLVSSTIASGIISILDLCARLAAVFNRVSPRKFGQQLAAIRDGKIWDNVLCARLKTSTALGRLREFRNAIGHGVSLKLRPVRVCGEWKAVLVRAHTDLSGLLLPEFLQALRDELKDYISFLDGHFAEKAGALNVLAKANKL